MLHHLAHVIVDNLAVTDIVECRVVTSLSVQFAQQLKLAHILPLSSHLTFYSTPLMNSSVRCNHLIDLQEASLVQT
jgi:hypothetical protein